MEDSLTLYPIGNIPIQINRPPETAPCASTTISTFTFAPSAFKALAFEKHACDASTVCACFYTEMDGDAFQTALHVEVAP
jgi:hypothetical protein